MGKTIRDKKGQYAGSIGDGKTPPVSVEDLRRISEALPLEMEGSVEDFQASVERAKAAFDIILNEKVRQFEDRRNVAVWPVATEESAVHEGSVTEGGPRVFTYEEAVAFLNEERPNKETKALQETGELDAAFNVIRDYHESMEREFTTNSIKVSSWHECKRGYRHDGEYCDDNDQENETKYLVTGLLAQKVRTKLGLDDSVQVFLVEKHALWELSEVTVDGMMEFSIQLSNGEVHRLAGSFSGTSIASLVDWLDSPNTTAAKKSSSG